MTLLTPTLLGALAGRTLRSGPPTLDLTYVMTPPSRTLTRREETVWARVASGATDQEIGRDLGISAQTVKYHVRQIKTKLAVSTRTELVCLFYGGVPYCRRWSALTG